MDKRKILEFLKVEEEIQKMNQDLKKIKQLREKLENEIIHFCQSEFKTKINLPDGSHLQLCKNNQYQSLSYTLLENQLKSFCRYRNQSLFPIDEFINYIKQNRQFKENYDIVRK
tara:strand:- start:5784 stop:6125 length:342 start_codon:yes stop_codon:yes gene_type:complete